MKTLIKKTKTIVLLILNSILTKIKFFPYSIRYLFYRNKYEISPSFKFSGIDIEFYGNGHIVIGDNSYIGNRSSICSEQGQIVKIGNNCSISHNVKIYTINKNPNDIINEKEFINSIKGNVIIGNNCWIGANVFINQGVNIGSNSVIGANSIVTKNFPSNVVIAGCPAKILKSKSKI